MKFSPQTVLCDALRRWNIHGCESKQLNICHYSSFTLFNLKSALHYVLWKVRSIINIGYLLPKDNRFVRFSIFMSHKYFFFTLSLLKINNRYIKTVSLCKKQKQKQKNLYFHWYAQYRFLLFFSPCRILQTMHMYLKVFNHCI